MISQADSDSLQNVSTSPSVPRRSRAKVLEVVQEMEVQLNPATGKPVRHSRGKSYKVRRWQVDATDKSRPRLVNSETTERANVEMAPTGRWRLNGYYLSGNRVRRLYSTEELAKGDLLKLAVETGNVDAKTHYALANRNDLVQDAIRAEALVKPFKMTLLEVAREYAGCLTELAPYGANLREVVKAYAEKEAQRRQSKPIGTMFADYLKELERRACRKTYLLDLRRRLRRFEEHFGSDTFACDVNAEAIREWLSSLNLSGTSQNNFARNVSGAFTFGKILPNPFDDVARVKKTVKEQSTRPPVFTPSQVRALLAQAHPQLVPMIAMGAFAGLRPESELARLNWRDVDFDKGEIHVEATNKVAQARTVKMPVNLLAWLAPYRGTKGRVLCSNHRKLRVAAMKLAKIKKWPADVLRHTAATNHIQTSGFERTALLLGNSESTLKKHYWNHREVSEESARDFFAIMPQTTAPTNIIRMDKVA